MRVGLNVEPAGSDAVSWTSHRLNRCQLAEARADRRGQERTGEDRRESVQSESVVNNDIPRTYRTFEFAVSIDPARLVERLLRQFEATPSSSLLQLARALRIHRHTAERAFHNALGYGFHVWRDSWRERRAQELLLNSPELSIKEVAVLVGLGGSGALRRLLVRRLGRTPTQVRRRDA